MNQEDDLVISFDKLFCLHKALKERARLYGADDNPTVTKKYTGWAKLIDRILLDKGVDELLIKTLNLNEEKRKALQEIVKEALESCPHCANQETKCEEGYGCQRVKE